MLREDCAKRIKLKFTRLEVTIPLASMVFMLSIKWGMTGRRRFLQNVNIKSLARELAKSSLDIQEKGLTLFTGGFNSLNPLSRTANACRAEEKNAQYRSCCSK
jgi:hypothetical protein